MKVTEKVIKKAPVKRAKRKATSDKKELNAILKTLEEIRDILDNTWRGRNPQ
jgi:hypothetical protein